MVRLLVPADGGGRAARIREQIDAGPQDNRSPHRLNRVMERRRTIRKPTTLAPTRPVPLPHDTVPLSASLPPEPPRTPAPGRQPKVGDVIGTYELVGLIGRGTTSIVYRGRHRKLEIPVAVKVLHPDELAN